MTPLAEEYSSLFTINAIHRFRANSLNEDFDLRPTIHTAGIMREFGLIFKPTTAGATVLGRVVSDGSGMFPVNIDSQSSFCLSFLLSGRSPELVNFSDLPSKRDPFKTYVLSNTNDNVQKKKRLLTSSFEKDALSESDLVKLRPRVFDLDIRKRSKTFTIKMTDKSGRLLLVKEMQPSSKIRQFPVDLRTYGGGLIEVNYRGAHESFYVSDEINAVSAMGIIDIHTGSQVPQDYRFISDIGQLQHRDYYIFVDSRKVYWQYAIYPIHRETLDKDSVSVTLTKGKDISFPLKGEIEKRDNKSVVVVRSKETVALSDKVRTGLSLTLPRANGGGKITIHNLPNPKPSAIRPTKSGGNHYSEVQLYV